MHILKLLQYELKDGSKASEEYFGYLVPSTSKSSKGESRKSVATSIFSSVIEFFIPSS